MLHSHVLLTVDAHEHASRPPQSAFLMLPANTRNGHLTHIKQSLRPNHRTESAVPGVDAEVEGVLAVA